MIIPTIQNNSWDVPRRQSPIAILIIMLQTAVLLIKTMWPVLLVYFFRKKQDEEGTNYLLIILGFGLVTIILAIIKYWYYTFQISGDNFIIKSGWLRKKTLTIHLNSIQAVHLEQNIWQQFLKVTKVKLDSAGSEKVEVKIDALTIAHAESLKGTSG